MKVVQFNDYFEHRGGVETYFLALIKELKKRIDIAIFAFGNKESKKKGLHISKAKDECVFARTFSSYFLRMKRYNEFKNFVANEKPDIVHLQKNSLFTNSILLALKKHRPKIPIVQTIHDYGILCPTTFHYKGEHCDLKFLGKGCLMKDCLPLQDKVMYFLLHWIKKAMVKSTVTHYIAGSHALKDALEKDGFKNVKVIPYFMDVGGWKFDQSQTDDKRILYVGRIEEEKGLGKLIDALADVKKEFDDFKLVVIGRGRKDKEYATLSKKLGINAEFLGGVDDKELIRKYYKSSFVVFPSLCNESFGYVGVEAMACGTPCISTKSGGPEEWLIDKKNGFLVDINDNKALSNRIIELLRYPKLALKFGKEGRKIAEERFGKEKHMESLLKFYKDIENN